MLRLTTAPLLLCLSTLLAGCGKKENDKKANFDRIQGRGVLVQPGIAPGESQTSGYLSLKILKVYENQKPLGKLPWHSDGGEWVFMDCEAGTAPKAVCVIGVKSRDQARPDVSLIWGEAMLAVADEQTGAKFLEIFAKAFHQPSPALRKGKPPGFVRVHTSVAGVNLARAAEGGFLGGGNWTATKWFLQDEDTDAEVFFNYDPKGGKAEFSEKDEDYREEMIAYFATAMRDGPLPERTPENDPTLTMDGPRVTDWKRIAAPDASCKFSPDSRSLAISESEDGGRSRIYLLTLTEPSERKLLAEFETMAAAQGFVGGGQRTLLVTETLPGKKGEFSPNNKQRLWLVNDTGKQELKMSAAITNWYMNEQCISPDGRFIVAHSWRGGSKQERTRVLHVCEIGSGYWRTVEKPGTVLGLAGWRIDKPLARVVTGTELDDDKPREVFELDVATGQLLPVASSRPDSKPKFVVSPARSRGFELRGSDALRITDLNANVSREFSFHPYDRRSVQQESLKWANDRYIIFQTSRRTELIDTETMKLNFPTENDSKIYCEFGPDFALALGHKEDATYLGRVIPPSH